MYSKEDFRLQYGSDWSIKQKGTELSNDQIQAYSRICPLHSIPYSSCHPEAAFQFDRSPSR
jgi:hypothetical protein